MYIMSFKILALAAVASVLVLLAEARWIEEEAAGEVRMVRIGSMEEEVELAGESCRKVK